MSNNINPYTGIRRKFFAPWKNQFSLLIKYLIFRVNTSEDHEALNLKSNGKNKYNIILSIGEDKVAKDAAEALLGKHPDTSIIATLDEQGKLVLPRMNDFFFTCCKIISNNGFIVFFPWVA
jgi:hypothetical protein